MAGSFAKSFKKIHESVGSPAGAGKSLWPLFISGVIALFISAAIVPSFFGKALPLAFFLAPLWMPFVLVTAAWRQWVLFRQAAFIASQKYILLEIRPPRTHAKTPLAMEAVLSGMHIGPGESTWYARLIKGSVRPWWSLEIAAIDGHLRFFVWTRAQFKHNIEAHFYAQYPGVQIVEVPDYARTISATTEEWSVWGCDFVHTKSDPYPIKTYVDYGLDKPAKEHEQTDPLANLLEYLAGFGAGEQVWLQFVIRTHKGEKYNKKNADGSPYTWKEAAMEEIQKIRARTVGKVKYKDIFTGEMRETEGFPNPTKGESETMAAIERNVSKPGFDVGVRIIYVAHPDKFVGTKIAGIIGLFRQFSSEGLNGFKPKGWLVGFSEYPWEPFLEQRQNIARRGVVDAYRRRQFFHEPHKSDSMVMSTEELATLYHIPSKAIETPTLARVTSATSTAPANLPI
ncbi:MAG TPA: hypothetical protein VF829_02045 [Candidatus Paceibacterota bacterium]